MSLLESFIGIEGTDFFEDDRGLQKMLGGLLPEEEKQAVFSSLHDAAKLVAGRWDSLAREGARHENLPRIVKHDRVARPVERVDYGPHSTQLRREVAEFGVLTSARSELHKFSLIYFLAHLGEAAVNCGMSCTDGAIRAIEARGSQFLRDNYLSRLRSVETPLAGAQFVTEQDGGSDVGVIETSAALNDDGSWSLTGEKWFCSNPDEYFVVAARPAGAPGGTDGVALFFVPRVLPDGSLNKLSFRRLKDKLGTRSLPTAEIEFEGAKAWALGDPAEGFKTLMNFVINASRVHNAVNACGFLHRALLEARNYARQREAFGGRLVSYPLIQETLVTLLERLWRQRLLTFRLVALLDKHGLTPDDPDQALWQRFLLNLAKYRTASALAQSIREAILVLGGNGIVEDFSVLPRLLRDSLIIETWEGAPNTLCLQIMRDAARSNLLERFRAEVGDILERWPNDFLSLTRTRFARTMRHLVELAPEHHLGDATWAQTHALRVVNLLGDMLELGWMAEMAAHENEDSTCALLTSFAAYHLLPDENPFEHPVLHALRPTAPALIDELPVRIDVSNL